MSSSEVISLFFSDLISWTFSAIQHNVRIISNQIETLQDQKVYWSSEQTLNSLKKITSESNKLLKMAQYLASIRIEQSAIIQKHRRLNIKTMNVNNDIYILINLICQFIQDLYRVLVVSVIKFFNDNKQN